MNIPNIKFSGQYAKFITSGDSPEYISFNKGAEYFKDLSEYNKFIKNIESMVRHSTEYSAFIAHIKNVIGINFCQVSSKILDTDATVEMHHGPIFTLYDYVSIILNKYIDNNIPVTSFAIANDVIDEHYAMRVQVVMLAITNHEGVHNKDIFLNIKQGVGNISEFIKIYAPYIDDEQKYKIARYITMCEDNDSFDNGILDCDGISEIIKL